MIVGSRSLQVRGAAMESVADASDESLKCSEVATSPTAIPAQASPSVKSTTSPEPDLVLCGQEHEAITTSDSITPSEPHPAQSVPPAAEEQVGFKAGTEEGGRGSRR